MRARELWWVIAALLTGAWACSGEDGSNATFGGSMAGAGPSGGSAGAPGSGQTVGPSTEDDEGQASSAGMGAAGDSADGAEPSQANPGTTDAGAPSDGAAVADAGAATAGALNGTGPGDWGPGDYPPDLNAQNYLEISGVEGQAGMARQYKVHVPPSYDREVPMPLVFCIHGLGQNAVMFCVDVAHMPEKADEEDFIVVMPNGFQNSWNAGTCCGGASTMELDDVALMRAIFGEVGTHLNVDLDRVYATGLSNGGYMSYRLACDAADIFAAVAPGAGAVGVPEIGGGTNPAPDFTACEPSQPVAVMAMHGTADPLIPYTVLEPSLEIFAETNGCGTSTVPATVPEQGGDTTCVTYEGCPDNLEVTGCSVEGGGHLWFGSGAGLLAGIGAESSFLVSSDAAWSFLKRLSR